MKTVILKKRPRRIPEPVQNLTPPDHVSRPGLKVLFLDLDGVLNFWTRADSLTEGIADMWTGRCLAPSCVEIFNQLVQDTGASVVISSTWKDRPEYRGDLEALKQTLQEGGVNVTNIIGVTPNIGPRVTEICVWLRHHPEVSGFAVLDDNVGGMHTLTPHLVLTQTSTGLVPEDALRAKACLGIQHNSETFR